MEASYVYGYFDPLTQLPFYIGKGTGRRMNHHLQEAKKDVSADTNLHKIRKIRKLLDAGLEPEIRIIDTGLTDAVAFELEEFMIDWIGRRDEGAGPLTNLSDGGEGGRGICHLGERNPNYGKRGEDSIWWGRAHSEETKEKMRAAQTGKEMTEAHKAAMRKPKSEEGRAAIALARKTSLYRPSEETKAKISAATKGKPSHKRGCVVSAETRLKQSLATKGVPKQKTACIHCGMLCAPNILHRWHMDNCKEHTNACQ